MESKPRIIGHPIHPMLIPSLVGMLTTSDVFDAVYVPTGSGLGSPSPRWEVI